MADIKYGALVAGAFVLLGNGSGNAVEAKPVKYPTSLTLPLKNTSVNVKPAQAKDGPPNKGSSASKPIQHPTEEERRWIGRSGEFENAATALVDKLRAGDVDAAVNLLPTTIEGSMGLTNEQFVREQLIPFFSDYKESDNEIVAQGVRENGDISGFANYEGFRTKNAERKYYFFKVLIRDGRPTVTAFKINWRVADDDPEMAQRLKERHPEVESIRPSDTSRVIWSAPGTK